MNFFYVKIFSLVFILSICELFHTYVCVENFILVRSLSDVLRANNLNTQKTECDLISDKSEKNYLKKYSSLINNTDNDYYNKRKKKSEKKLKDKYERHNIVEYNLLGDKLTIDKSFVLSGYNKKITHNTKTYTIKDKLYEMVFKGKTFWKSLSYTIGYLGLKSSIYLFIGSILKLCGGASVTAATFYLGAWGCLVFLIILIIVGVWILTTWLWAHKDIYNKKYGV
ncbi:Plasmodium exported protein (hyp15), unknown function [Plasmodium sp. DRC-Itaito]|nr:Plasmodium exported protein (hyp15), unknown function [Plasmodium sp. DRC-Itaito]